MLCRANVLYGNRISSPSVSEPDDVKQGRLKLFLLFQPPFAIMYVSSKKEKGEEKEALCKLFCLLFRQLILQEFTSSKEEEAIDEVNILCLPT